jgi:hypothetical protein
MKGIAREIHTQGSQIHSNDFRGEQVAELASKVPKSKVAKKPPEQDPVDQGAISRMNKKRQLPHKHKN